MEIPVFGKEQYPLNRESGLSYTISDIYKHVPIHTHTHYELFIISDGAAYHMINDSVQTVRKGDLFFIRPNDMHSYNFYHSENFCVRNLGFSTQVLRNVSLFLEQEEEQEQLEKVCRKLLKLFAWEKASPSDIRFRLASSMLSLNKKKEAGDFCERWYGEDENDPAAAAALIYAWIADRRYKDAQKVVDFWMDKEGGYTEENAEVFGAAAVLQNIFPGKGKDKVLEA